MSSRRRRQAKASQNRKRQPKGAKKRSKKPMRWLVFCGVAFFVCFLLGVFLAYHAVRTYLRSDDFRVMLGSQAGALLDGEAEFSDFEWDGWSVATEEFSFQGEDGLQNLIARGIDAEVDTAAVWKRTYRIEEVRLREVELIGDFRKKPVEEVEAALVIPGERVARGGDRGEERSFWDVFLPKRLEITGLDVGTINGRAVTDDGIWAWRDTTARVRPGSSKKTYDVELTGGEITTPLALVDRLSLKRVEGRYAGDRFYLLSSQFDALKNARVTVEGDLGLQSRAWNLHGEVQGARVEELIAEDWKQRFMGPLSLNFSLRGRPDYEARIKGEITIKDGVLTALPVLDRIAAYANTARFRRLALSEARLNFEKVGSSLELSHIVLASEGLVRLEGSMRLDGEVIRKGDFRVGITPGTLTHIPGAETKVFQRGELGLLWAPMVISGTIDSPQEDLSERLIAAAGERMFELVPETGKFALRYSGQVIGESTQKILKQQGVILESGRGVLGQAVDLIESETGVGPSGAIDTGVKTVEEGVGKLFDLFGRSIEKRD